MRFYSNLDNISTPKIVSTCLRCITPKSARFAFSKADTYRNREPSLVLGH